MEYGTQNVLAHYATASFSSRNATPHFSLFSERKTKKESVTGHSTYTPNKEHISSVRNKLYRHSCRKVKTIKRCRKRPIP
jgi:hypothetical protein